MRYVFDYSRKQIAAACLFSGLIAAGVSTMTNPSAADHASAMSVSINRTIKSDRLPLAPSHKQLMDNSGGTDTVQSPKPPSLGCDPAFSRIAEPARADIVKRCLA
jgi:hypothetical protein